MLQLRNICKSYTTGTFTQKALEDDSQAFVDKAHSHDLLLVQSDCFGVPGWARAGYCVSADTIANSRKAWAALKADYE